MKTRKSILFKVAFSNSLVILLVFFLVCGLIAVLNTRLTLERERQSVSASLTSSISSVDNKLRDMARVSLLCYTDQKANSIIQDYKAYSYAQRLESERYLQNLMLSMIALRNDINGVFIFDTESLIYKYDYWRISARPNYDITQAFWYPGSDEDADAYLNGCKLTMGTAPDFLKPTRNEAPFWDEFYLYMTREVESFSPRRPIGCIVLISPAAELNAVIEEYLGEDYFYLVLGQDGTVVCEPSGGFTGLHVAQAFPDIVPTQMEIDGNLMECGIGGVDYMLGSHLSEYSGLTFVIGRPSSVLFRDTWQMLSVIIGISLAAIAVSVGSMLTINRRTLRPIQRLGDTMAAVGPGTTVVTLPVTGNDEVARLTRAFNQMMETINDLIFSEYENTIKLQQSQLRHRELQLLYLRSQINPHFLYNTLDTIRMKAALEGNEEVAELILMLVDFFRFSIGNNATTVNLAHEVQLMRIYLQLMKQRYPSITDRYEIDERLNDLLIPSFILQPLVENSIKHGLKHTGYRGCITLRVYRDPEVPTDALIEVVDDGAGISAERLQDVRRLLGTEDNGQLGTHVGLSNIRERLCTFYPGRFSLEMRPNPGQGVTVSIRIDTTIAIEQDPLRLEERDGTMGTGEAAAD